MRQFWLSAVALLTFILTPPAFAQSRGGSAGGDSPVYFEETFFPVYVNRNDTRSVTDSPGVATESGLGYDFRTTLGLTFWDQLLVGLSYNIYHLNTKRPNVVNGDSGLNETTNRSEFGPTLGYMNSGWRLLLTFFMSGSQQIQTQNFDNTGTTGDVTIKNTGLSGFQVTTGYTFSLGSGFELGPSLVYRSVSYAKQSKVNALNSTENYGSTSLYSKSVDATLNPMVTIIVRF
jgi:hypothetical protein